jgi:hypothetical protein
LLGERAEPGETPASRRRKTPLEDRRGIPRRGSKSGSWHTSSIRRQDLKAEAIEYYTAKFRRSPERFARDS